MTWRSITTDPPPKDGTLIWVADPDCGVFPMRWAAIQRNGLFPSVVGMWVLPNGEFTWTEHDGFGPTLWLPLDPDTQPPPLPPPHPQETTHE